MRPSTIHRENRARSEPLQSPSVARVRNGARSTLTESSKQTVITEDGKTASMVNTRRPSPLRKGNRTVSDPLKSPVARMRSGARSVITVSPRRSRKSSSRTPKSGTMMRSQQDSVESVSYRINHFNNCNDDVNSVMVSTTGANNQPCETSLNYTLTILCII